jgi:hypothetical protein
MSKSKTLNRHLVGRRLESAIHGGQLPDSVAQAATVLLARVDANEQGIGAATRALISEAWMTTARSVSNGESKTSALKAIAELEASLGLAPVSEVEPVAEAFAEAVADTDDDTVAEVAPVTAPAPVWSQS